MNRAFSILEIKEVTEQTRTFEGIASTPTPDRIGDVVEPLGAQFNLPMPLLLDHSSRDQVGHVTFAKPNKKGIPFKATITRIDEPGDAKNLTDKAWHFVKHGLRQFVSIGFRALEDGIEVIKETDGFRFTKWEWLELSLVSIPAQPEAVITQLKSIDAALLAASGQQEQRDRSTPAGVTAPRSITVVKARQEGKRTMSKRTIAEQISAFEATRAAKVARMTELMDAANEKGETLDEAAQEEYDGLEIEVKKIDDHLVRLHKQEQINKTQAVEVKAETPKQASESRGGVRVEGVKANVPKGIPFTRFVLALAAARGSKIEAIEIIRANKAWMDQTPEVELAMKAAVLPGTTTDSTWAGPLVNYQIMAQDMIEYLRPRTIIDRITGLRRVPFKIKVPRQTAVAAVNWVGETKPKPVGKEAFDTVTLDVNKIAGIIALSEELVKLSNPSAENLAREDLAAGIVQLMDHDFVDPAKAAAAGVSPASVTNGVSGIPASGTAYSNFATDVKAALANFTNAGISTSNLTILMREDTALSLSFMLNALGQAQFPGLSAQGGTINNVQVITSNNIPYTGGSAANGAPIIFLAPTEIMLADEGGVNIDISREASVQMSDAPDDPSTATTILASFWQNNLVGVRAERMITWVKRRAEAAQLITGAKYA